MRAVVSPIITKKPQCSRGDPVIHWINADQPTKYDTNTCANPSAIKVQTENLPALRQKRSIVISASSARLRTDSLPSNSRSMGRKTNSMYTVCGQAQPHQARPKRAVIITIPKKMLMSVNIIRSVSVGRNVAPKM
jgi:hypothetical protein